ncbi:MAG: zinc-dependent peptidase [Burkholderiaceae bacterium]
MFSKWFGLGSAVSPDPDTPGPVADWADLIDDCPIAAHLDAAARERLAGLSEAFLTRHRIVGAAGWTPGERIRRLVACQACIPVLELGLAAYGDFVDVIIYPDEFRVRRQVTDPLGLETEFDHVLAGEAMDHGPVVLSLPGLDPRADDTGEPGDWPMNLVVHEFTHKLDQTFALSHPDARSGPDPIRALRTTLAATYDDLLERIDWLEDKLPRDVDPESPAAQAWFATLPLDPYAATDPAECLAVAAEAFFSGSVRLARNYPALQEALAGFFGQRPRLRDDVPAPVGPTTT